MDAEKLNIIAVVVTFNRLHLLQKNIACLRQNKSLNEILVVNNGSTDGTLEWLDTQKDLWVIHQANVGGSGGFYVGIQEAYNRGADWIWCMDDDVFPRADCLANLLLHSNHIGVGILAPRRLMDGKVYTNDFLSYNLVNPFSSMYGRKLKNMQVDAPIEIKGTAFIFVSQAYFCSYIEQFAHLMGNLKVIVKEIVPFLFKERCNIIGIILKERRRAVC